MQWYRVFFNYLTIINYDEMHMFSIIFVYTRYTVRGRGAKHSSHPCADWTRCSKQQWSHVIIRQIEEETQKVPYPTGIEGPIRVNLFVNISKKVAKLGSEKGP